MKLFIDTKNKIIKIEETVNFGEMMEKVKKLLPGEWKDYKLETNTEIQWVNPVVINDWPLYPNYPYWWTQPYYSIPGTMNLPKTTTVTYTNDSKPLIIDMNQQKQFCIEC